MDNFYGPLSVRIYITPYLKWEKLGAGRGVTRKERGIPLCCPSPDYRRFVNLVFHTLINGMTGFFPWEFDRLCFSKGSRSDSKQIVYFYSVINDSLTNSADVHSAPSWRHKWSDFEHRPWCLAIVVPTPPVRQWSSSLRGGWGQCVIAVPRGVMLCGRSSLSFSSPFFLQQDAEDSV